MVGIYINGRNKRRADSKMRTENAGKDTVPWDEGRGGERGERTEPCTRRRLAVTRETEPL
jgi:hypothetical protein